MTVSVDLFETVLATAAFNGIAFPVVSASTPGGHNGVKHRSYGRRGADCEPTGQKEYTGQLVIPFVNELKGFEGVTLWPDRMNQLIAEFEANPIGTLQHPSKWSFDAFIEEWNEELNPDFRNGVMLVVKWTEHNGEASNVTNDSDQQPQNTPTAATNQAAAADSTMSAYAVTASTSAQIAAQVASGSLASGSVVATVVSFATVAPTVIAQIAFLEDQPRTPNQIQAAISAMLAPVQANLALPQFTGAAAYPVVAALEALQATIYALRSRYMAGFDQAITYTVKNQMSALQIAQLIYGDGSALQKVLFGNSIGDPLVIMPGKVLVLLP